MLSAVPKSSPLAHQVTRPKPSTSSPSHRMNRSTMDAGPTKDMTRSRAS